MFPQGVKYKGREAGHPPPSSSEVKNSGIIPPFPHTSSPHNAQLIKPRDVYVYVRSGPLNCDLQDLFS